MLWIALVLCFGGFRVLAAPTVHLTKLDDGQPLPDYQRLFPTNPTPFVDPVWMTVTSRPSLQAAPSVTPLSTNTQSWPESTSQQPPQPSPGAAPYQPSAPTSGLGPQHQLGSTQHRQPAVSYQPFYLQEPVLPSFETLQHVAVANPHYQYHYQNNFPVAWSSVIPRPVQPLLPSVQVQPPCEHTVGTVAVQGYQHRGY